MTFSRPMGRKPSPFDARDYKLTRFMPTGFGKLSLVDEMMWEFPLSSPLDQELTNHCVGFSGANWGINLPIQDDYDNQTGHDFYYECKVIDGEPENEDGSYVRSIAQVLRQNSRIEAYAFANSMESIKWWLLNRGPLTVGTVWTDDMFIVKPDGTLDISGNVSGGHAYVLNGYRKDDYIRIQNSWGSGWGDNGQAWISSVNFEQIFRYGGEAMTAVELPLGGVDAPVTGNGCIMGLLEKLWDIAT